MAENRYCDIEAFLDTIPQYAGESGVVRAGALLEELGHPEKTLKIIHVAGSNGKGSVCAYLNRILIQHGFRTGLFTSPHLVDVRERIRIDKEMVSFFVRDRKYQAILPLRGKVVNTEKAAMTDILKNEEIATIINTIGAGVGADFNEKDSNYNKVIIMTDADTDGAHIQILLLTFFYRYMRDLITAGKVYIALPPLYKVSKKSGKKEDIVYAWEEDELEEAKKKIGRGYNVQRYKGLGEMNASQLWETTMNPETRTLIQVSIEDAAIVERRVSVLMGDKVEPRREWIEQNVQFTLEDNFAIE